MSTAARRQESITEAGQRLDHSAGVLASVLNAFVAKGIVELPPVMQEDLADYRAALASYRAAIAATAGGSA